MSTWEKDYRYKRILEILHDYWLSEPDEFRVRVHMDFIKANGETQSKEIYWQNPNYECSNQRDPEVIDMTELIHKSDYEIYMDNKKSFFNTGKIRRKQNAETTGI